jgi:nucleoporin NUP42
MVVCKYFQQGSCRFGDQCRFEHIDANGRNVGSGGSSDPFAPSPSLKRGSSRGGGGGAGGTSAKRPTPIRDKPQWPLTCVASHPVAAGNAIMGDMSQEELRVLAYQQAPGTRGCAPEVVAREQGLVAEFQQRNNSAPPPPAAAAVAADPFAGQQQHMGQGGAAAQQPIFGGMGAAQEQHAPIFGGVGTGGAPAPAGFAQPQGSGFAVAQPVQQFQHAPTMTSPPQPSAPVVPAASPFAFQQVPLNPPS